MLSGVAGTVLLASVVGAQAETFTWGGAGPEAPWKESSNWSPNGLPTADDDVIISQHRAIVDNEQSAGTIVLNNSGLTIEATGDLTFQQIELISSSSLANHGAARGSVLQNDGIIQNHGSWAGDVESNDN